MAVTQESVAASTRIPASAAAPDVYAPIALALMSLLCVAILLTAVFVVHVRPAAGVLLLLVTVLVSSMTVGAARELIRTRRYRSELLLDGPARIGGACHGQLFVSADRQTFSRAKWMRATLWWLGRRYNSGAWSDIPIWQDTEELAGDTISIAEGGISVPIRFDIPNDADPTDHRTWTTGRTVWRVDFDAEIGGKAYTAQFEVPVTVPAEAPLTREDSRARTISEPPTRAVAVADTPLGLRLDFGADRFSLAARGPLIASTIAVGASFVVMAFGKSLLASAVVIAFTVYFLYSAIEASFATTCLLVGNKSISIERHLLTTTRTVIPSAEIADVQIRIRQWSGSMRKLRCYYALEALLKNQRRLTLVQRIEKKDEGAWLVQRIRQAMGLPLTSAIEFNPWRRLGG